MAKRIGKNTISLSQSVGISGFYSAVGKKEAEGPLGNGFDESFEDEYLGQKTYEAAESVLMKTAVSGAMKNASCSPDTVDLFAVGDLLDQSMASTYGIKDFSVPHIGLFGACSTCALSMAVAALMVDGGGAARAVAATSSHFCTAERQFRFPLEYGSKRTPNSQRTVTGAGAVVVEKIENGPQIKAVTFGKIVDYDVTDANNMGAAMAPSAAVTIKSYLEDTKSNPSDFDLILTGDLGKIGSALLIELLQKDGIDISEVHNDCGLMIYDINEPDFAAGGSGCGCSGSVVCSNILTKLKSSELKRILFCGTGALLSPTSTNQGLSIPGVSHLVELSSVCGV